MNNDVAHCSHLRPWKLSMLIDKIRCQGDDLAHSLADNLDVAYHRILNLPVLFERLKVRQGLKVVSGALDGFRNVSEVIFDAFRVLHKGRAWRKTVPRNFGGNPFGVSTDTGTPSNFSASILKAASVKRLVDSPGSTSKSRSLWSVSVPVKIDPKTRGRERP